MQKEMLASETSVLTCQNYSHIYMQLIETQNADFVLSSCFVATLTKGLFCFGSKFTFYHQNNKMDKIGAVWIDDTTRPAQQFNHIEHIPANCDVILLTIRRAGEGYWGYFIRTTTQTSSMCIDNCKLLKSNICNKRNSRFCICFRDKRV